jgi:hypothetical protein
MTLFLTAAIAQTPAPTSADVQAVATVARPVAQVAARLDSTTDLAELLPQTCVKDWEHGVAPTGPARMTYRILSFRRRLTGRIVERIPGQVIELDHEGRKGFVTRFHLTPVDETHTRVELTTFINPPGWPFRSYYADKVKPLWEACYVEALAALESP